MSGNNVLLLTLTVDTLYKGSRAGLMDRFKNSLIMNVSQITLFYEKKTQFPKWHRNLDYASSSELLLVITRFQLGF